MKRIFIAFALTSLVGVLSHTALADKFAVGDVVAGKATGENTRDDQENLLDRLKRLAFNVSEEDETRIRISIRGGDVPVYISSTAERDVSGDAYYMAYKLYEKRFIPRSKQSLKLLHSIDNEESGWQVFPLNDGQCGVLNFRKIKNSVSDSELADAILSIQRVQLKQFPIPFDKEYQKRWSTYLLLIFISSQYIEDGKTMEAYRDDLAGYCKHSPYNQTNRENTIAHIRSYSMCPEEVRQAAIDFVNAQTRLFGWFQDLSNSGPDNSIDEAVNFVATLGSMDEDNPQGGALLGGILGAVIGSAQQENRKQQAKGEYDRLSADAETKKTHFLNIVKPFIDKIPNDQELGRTPICDINEE